MAKNTLEVIIQPTTLRFRLFKDQVYYLFASGMEAQLDDAELMFGVDPAKMAMLESNVGFLPVCSTVLVRGEKNILIDPNNAHIGIYGLLANALGQRGLGLSDIDVVVATHWHHDHSANVGMFKKGELVVGKDELDCGRAIYGEDNVKGVIKGYDTVREIDGRYEIAPGVTAVYMPGHSPGSLSVFVEDEAGRTVVAGDTIMVEKEWTRGEFSHWSSKEQLSGMAEGVKMMRDWAPDRIVPGHDKVFRV